MHYKWDFSSILQYNNVLIEGLLGTFYLSIASLICAVVFGMALALLRMSRFMAVRAVAAVIVNFFRNIPFIVQMFWFYYAIPILTGFQTKAFPAAFAALSLYCGVYFSEIFRSGIQGIDKGQWEGARAIGLGYGGTLRDVILPQALRRVIPPLTTQVIELVKLTTVASSIAYFELLYAGKLVADQDLRPIEAYTTVAMILIVILLGVAFVGVRLEKKFKIRTR